MTKRLLRSMTLFLLILVIAGCGTPPATPAATQSEPEPTATDPVASISTEVSSTADPCSLPQLEKEVQRIHTHMREFDDAAILASNRPRDQLGDSIEDLQRIRRQAEDEQIPGCLTNLKAFQVQHMNSVITTLIGFMGGTDQQSLDQGIALARHQHDQYTLELARVLGLTIVAATPPPTQPVETGTPTP